MTRLDASLRRVARHAATCLWRACLVSTCLVAASVSGAPQAMNIRGGDATRTLRQFARQAGVQLVFPVEDVRGLKTNEVYGQFEPRQALDKLLRGSGLTFVEDPGTGAFVVRRQLAGSGEAPRAGDGPAVAVAVEPGQPVADTPRGTDDVEVVLSPFEIQTRSDRGYRPANSVSATRISAPISTLPMTVSAFTEEFIADQKAYDLYDVVKWTPGVHQDNVSPQGWARYAVRGFTSASIQRNGFGSFRFIDTTNIARVEVVKGPYSLLYGQINPGGVINYITKRPQRVPATELTASTGSHGYSRFVVDATGPVPRTEESVLVRAVAMTESIQQFQQFAEGRKYLLAPSVKWQVNDQVSLVVDYEHFERREDMITGGVVQIYRGGVATGPYPGLPWDFSYAGEGDFQDFVSDALTLELELQLSDAIHVRASYLDASWDQEWRASGQGATGLVSQETIDHDYPPPAGLTPPDAMIRRNRWEDQRGGERSLQVDLTGTGELGGVKLRTLVGVKSTVDTFFRNRQRNNSTTPGHPLYLRPWDLRDDSTWDRRVPFAVDDLVLVADSESGATGQSAYAVVSGSALDERLHVLGGYALHTVRNEAAINRITGAVTPASERSKDVPQFGALYRLSREVSAFATYSESFRANATMLRVDNVPTSPAAPSVGRGWEAGAKLELWDGRVSGTLSAYTIEASPTGVVIVTTGIDTDGTTLFSDIQGGRQESRGFEAELLVEPVRNLQVYAALGTCEAIYAEHPSMPVLDGTRLVAAPEFTASLWGRYTIGSVGSTRWVVTGGMLHVGELALVANNPRNTVPAYTTFDLGVGCHFRLLDRPWSVDVLVKNVTDRHYFVSASSWGFPRHAIATLSTRF